MKFKLTTKDGQALKLNPLAVQGWARFGLVVFVTVFCLYSAKTFINRIVYEQRVIAADQKASNQLDANNKNAASLSNQFNSLFENNNSTNFLGGKNDSSATAIPPDVDNARLALDALPTTYDYPALLASVSKILSNNQISSPNISGSDQGSSVSSVPSANPQPSAIKLTISGTGNYATVQSTLKDLERSIRPFDITSLQLSGSESSLGFTINVTTYFQPAKILGITEGSFH